MKLPERPLLLVASLAMVIGSYAVELRSCGGPIGVEYGSEAIPIPFCPKDGSMGSLPRSPERFAAIIGAASILVTVVSSRNESR